MEKMEKFCLEWKDFETNIRESFGELRETQNYCDVTLATDDGHTIEAHKIILAAGSLFFRSILRQTKHSSPLIYLKGINNVELEYILSFLYNGEVFIAQEELNTFLKTAQELQVKGLQNDQLNASDPNKRLAPECIIDSEVIKSDTKMSMNPDIDNHVFIKSNKDLTENLADNEVVFVGTNEDNLVNTNLELDLQIEQMIEKREGLWQCKQCGKTASKNHKDNIRSHVETHIKGVSHTCKICNKI